MIETLDQICYNSIPCLYLLMQNYDGGRLVDTDIFFDYVELVEEPLKALLITNKYIPLLL